LEDCLKFRLFVDIFCITKSPPHHLSVKKVSAPSFVGQKSLCPLIYFVKKVFAPLFFLVKKVSAPSFFITKKVSAPSFSGAKKVTAPSSPCPGAVPINFGYASNFSKEIRKNKHFIIRSKIGQLVSGVTRVCVTYGVTEIM